MKKILLGLASIGVMITPVAAIVACGSKKSNDDDKKTKPVEKTKEDATPQQEVTTPKDWGVGDVSTPEKRAALLRKLTSTENNDVDPKGTIVIEGTKMNVARARIELQQWDANHPIVVKPGKNASNPLNFTSLESIRTFLGFTLLQIQANNGQYHYKIKGTLTKSSSTYTFTLNIAASETTGVFPYADLQIVRNAITSYLASLTRPDYNNTFSASLDFKNKAKLLSATFLAQIKRLPMTETSGFLRRQYYYASFSDLARILSGYSFKILTPSSGSKVIVAVGPGLFSGDETYASSITVTNLGQSDFVGANPALAFQFTRGNFSKIIFRQKPSNAAVATPNVPTKLLKQNIYNAFTTGFNFKARAALISKLQTLDRNLSPTLSPQDAENKYTKTYSLTFQQLSNATRQFQFKLVVALDNSKIIVPLFALRSLNPKLLNYPDLKSLEASDLASNQKISLVFQLSTTSASFSKLFSFEIKSSS